MISLLQFGTVIVAGYTAYFFFVTWLRESRSLKAAHQHGCQSVTKVSTWDPFFGVDLFIRIRKADAAGYRSAAYRDLHQKYGATFLMTALSTELQTSEPENIQAICTSAFEDFGVGPMRGRIGVPFLDRGIFTEDGDFWRHSRGLIRPTFNKVEIADLPNFERHVLRFFSLIPRDGSTFDMLALSKKLFLDTSTEFLFGQSTECLTSQTPAETDEFMAAFDRSLLGLALLLIFGPLRWPLYLDPYWKKAYTKVHAFVDRNVERALAKLDSDEKKSDGPKKYVVLEEMAKITRDPYELRMQILNVFFPARDTAAIAFANAIFLLARHPLEWEKLRTEVLSIDPQQSLSFEFIRSLKFTKAIVNETLRLHPAASRISRISLKDTILPRGGGLEGKSPIFVPKGQIIEMDLYSVQRDPAIWGPDADKFKPDRWNEGRSLWEAKWQYEPFLGGIRMCPAQNMVVTQMAYLLVRFAQEFQVLENRDEVEEYLELITMTVESKNGVKIAVQSA